MSTPEKNGTIKAALPLIIFFLLSTTIFVGVKKQFAGWGIDPIVAGTGNFVLFAVTLISFLLYKRAMSHATTMGFLRNTYGGLFFKLIVCAAVLAAYVLTDKEHVNKPAIYICVFLYLVYTVLEMRSLMQWNKVRKNG